MDLNQAVHPDCGVLEVGPSVSDCPSLQNGAIQKLMFNHIPPPPFTQNAGKHFREAFEICVRLH